MWMVDGYGLLGKQVVERKLPNAQDGYDTEEKVYHAHAILTNLSEHSSLTILRTSTPSCSLVSEDHSVLLGLQSMWVSSVRPPPSRSKST